MRETANECRDDRDDRDERKAEGHVGHEEVSHERVVAEEQANRFRQDAQPFRLNVLSSLRWIHEAAGQRVAAGTRADSSAQNMRLVT